MAGVGPLRPCVSSSRHRLMAVGCCELDLHQCFSFSNFPRLSCLQIESPIHLRFYYPIRRNNQLRGQGFHACEEPFHWWSCSSTPPISGDARLNVVVGLVATSWFRSSGYVRFFGPQSACVNKPGTILAGPFLCRIEIVVMAMTSYFIGGYLSEKNNGKSMAN